MKIIDVGRITIFEGLYFKILRVKCQRSKWTETMNFPLLCQTHAPRETTLPFAGKKSGSLGALVKTLQKMSQETLQSLKKTKEMNI